jgi:hypothetical protein
MSTTAFGHQFVLYAVLGTNHARVGLCRCLCVMIVTLCHDVRLFAAVTLSCSFECECFSTIVTVGVSLPVWNGNSHRERGHVCRSKIHHDVKQVLSTASHCMDARLAGVLVATLTTATLKLQQGCCTTFIQSTNIAYGKHRCLMCYEPLSGSKIDTQIAQS